MKISNLMFSENHIYMKKKDNNKQERKIGYFPDGSISFSHGYKNGKRDGICVGYYPNGQKMYEYLYNEGEFITVTKYDKNGNII